MVCFLFESETITIYPPESGAGVTNTDFNRHASNTHLSSLSSIYVGEQ